MISGERLLIKVTMPAPSTNDRAYVLLSALGISDGEAACLQVVTYRKYTSAGVLEDAAVDRDVVSIEEDSTLGWRILITEGTTGFTEADYYEVEVQARAAAITATATVYTAS